MRPIYECPENNISAKSADDCARISTLQSHHYLAVKVFSNVITAPSDLNLTDGRQTDVASPRGKNIKIRRQIIADIIGITDILSQRYRYIVDFKNRHGPSLLTNPIYASGQCLADWFVVGRGLGSAVFFLWTRTVRASKLCSAYKLAKLWQNLSRRETDHETAGPCGVRKCSAYH